MIRPLDFADLELEMDILNVGALLYKADVLAKIARTNGLDPAAVLADEDRACGLIAGWYLEHREAGGKADSVAEAVVAILNARMGRSEST